MNIDSCRIGSEERTYDIKGGENLNQLSRPGKNDKSDSKGLGSYGVGAKQISIGKKTVSGRFPANLILKHGNDCYCEGTKKVKGTPKSYVRSAKGNNRGQTYGEGMGQEKGQFSKNYGGEDGTKEVPNWICAPSCPVRILDAQSGTSTSVDAIRRNSVSLGSSKGGIYSEGTSYFEVKGYSDKDGASRFFKQVQTEEDLDEYLNRLIHSKDAS